jgi:hypothetical protein
MPKSPKQDIMISAMIEVRARRPAVSPFSIAITPKSRPGKDSGSAG